MIINTDYYINTYELMLHHLPRPSVKNPDFMEDGEDIPIITIEIKEVEL